MGRTGRQQCAWEKWISSRSWWLSWETCNDHELTLPVKDVEFVVGHGVDLLFEYWNWHEMSGSVQQHASMFESWLIVDHSRVKQSSLRFSVSCQMFQTIQSRKRRHTFPSFMKVSCENVSSALKAPQTELAVILASPDSTCNWSIKKSS